MEGLGKRDLTEVTNIKNIGVIPSYHFKDVLIFTLSSKPMGF
jgi:hypothetical protein